MQKNRSPNKTKQTNWQFFVLSVDFRCSAVPSIGRGIGDTLGTTKAAAVLAVGGAERKEKRKKKRKKKKGEKKGRQLAAHRAGLLHSPPSPPHSSMADDGTYLRTETVPIHRSWGTHRDGKVEARSPVHRAWASSRDGPVTSTASWKQTARWSMQTTSPKKRTGGRSSSPTKKTAGVRSEGRLRVGLGGSLGSSSKHNHLSGSNAMAEQENLAVTTGKRLLHASDYDGPSTFTAGPKLSVVRAGPNNKKEKKKKKKPQIIFDFHFHFPFLKRSSKCGMR